MKLSTRLCHNVFVALAICALALIGCESTETYGISITPSEVHMNEEYSVVELTGKGWDNFKWEISNTKIGHLSAKMGKSVIYYGTDFSEDEIQTVTATTIGFGSSTNSVSQEAIAHIKHISTKSPGPNKVKIEAAEKSIKAGKSTKIYVTNPGAYHYEWKSSRGSIDPNKDSSYAEFTAPTKPEKSGDESEKITITCTAKENGEYDEIKITVTYESDKDKDNESDKNSGGSDPTTPN